MRESQACSRGTLTASSNPIHRERVVAPHSPHARIRQGIAEGCHDAGSVAGHRGLGDRRDCPDLTRQTRAIPGRWRPGIATGTSLLRCCLGTDGPRQPIRSVEARFYRPGPQPKSRSTVPPAAVRRSARRRANAEFARLIATRCAHAPGAAIRSTRRQWRHALANASWASSMASSSFPGVQSQSADEAWILVNAEPSPSILIWAHQ
jgi:hypothetical protein